MITWTCKAVGLTLALGVLAGCEDVTSELSIGSNEAAAVSQARMAFGAVTLKPPTGYCIDTNSLRQNFALMARCDVLGAPSAAAGASRGIMTASFAAADTLPTPDQTAAALSLEEVSDATQADTNVTFRAKGAAPVEGLSASHWRATALVGTQVMSLALFGPSGGSVTGSEGRTLLKAVIKQAQSASE